MFVSAPTMYKDVYKEFHRPAYHPEVSKVYANYVSRSSKHSNTKTDFTVHVGLQGFIKDFLLADWQHNFFSVDENTAVFQHGRILSAMLGQKVDTTYLRELHRLGYLPLRIKSLPEGTFVPYQVSPVTIENTVEGFQWLTNMIETAFSTDMWYTQTSATTSVAYYATFLKYARMTGLDESFVQFQGHDFSARGLAGRGAWTLAGFGHLASGFVGTDTIPAVIAAEEYYNANVDTELVGCSVPATEHSVTCSWQEEGEIAFYRYLMNMVPTGILSLVFDTWDFWNGVTNILPELKDEIIARDGTIVIRPDSGDPVKILTGYTHNGKVYESKILTGNRLDSDEVVNVNGTYFSIVNGLVTDQIVEEHEVRGLIECLWDVFGGTITDKGYKLLSDKIGAIYGDSITLERQEQILSRLAAKGFASKVVLGIGSYTYQYVTRDTHGSAIKATNVFKNGRDVAICKEPKTDLGKKSAKGLLRVERIDGKLVQYDQQTREQEQQGLLEVVFEDGKLIKETSLAEIRKLVREQLDQM